MSMVNDPSTEVRHPDEGMEDLYELHIQNVSVEHSK